MNDRNIQGAPRCVDLTQKPALSPEAERTTDRMGGVHPGQEELRPGKCRSLAAQLPEGSLLRHDGQQGGESSPGPDSHVVGRTVDNRKPFKERNGTVQAGRSGN